MKDESNPLKVREERLKGLVDDIIKLGYSVASMGSGKGVTEIDLGIIEPYCNSLGFKPVRVFGQFQGSAGIYQGWGLQLVRLPEKEEVEKEDGISVSVKDYELLKFCRKNWVCRFLYTILPKR